MNIETEKVQYSKEEVKITLAHRDIFSFRYWHTDTDNLRTVYHYDDFMFITDGTTVHPLIDLLMKALYAQQSLMNQT